VVDLAILIGIFSYAVFGLGLLGRLGELELRSLGVLGGLGILGVVLFRFRIGSLLKKLKLLRQDRIFILLLALLFASVIVNMVGVLGPELGFDALWYHLTIPKIYLSQNKIFFIPGSLFYYSAMPKLTEMLYLVSLVFSPIGTLAKLIHFSFGILSAIALYRLAKRYLKTRESLLTVLIFYTTLIVGWQSITAYIDLTRTFFEILALDLFLRWWGRDQTKKEDKLLLIESAIMLGLAVSTKLIAFVSLPIYLILILFKSRRPLNTIYYILYTVLIPLPWFVFSYLYTGNPIYPVFSGILDQSHKIVTFDLIRVFRDFWGLLYHPQDFISPVFLIFLPIVILMAIKGRLKDELRVLLGYVFLTALFWYFTPRTGGSRFVLPYLPALSLLIVGIVSSGGKFFQKAIYIFGILIAVINIGYRALANKKYIPVIAGGQSWEEFLVRNLNFQNGDFFDQDEEIKKMAKNDPVLIYGSHNLFYVDFPFVHSSYAGPNLPVSYILVQNKNLPKNIPLGKLIYNNRKTGVELYISRGNLK